ncbi:unnamed protein product, partial [Tetraodon nigroviridis]
RRRHRLLGAVMMLQVLACVLMGVSWTLSRDDRVSPKVASPSGRFRRPRAVATPLWNREQRRLDLIYNLPASSSPGQADAGPAHPCQPDHGVPVQVWDQDLLPFRDFVLHMRCRRFPMLRQPARACARTPFLLLAVGSLVPHLERRQAIRQTWGRAGSYGNRTVQTLFLLGRSSPLDHSPDLQGLLGREAELHQDVLQWDYRDTVLNRTLKGVLFLEWFSQNCPRARFVLQSQDDVFVNTFGMLRLLEELPEREEKDLFLGDVVSGAAPHRDPALRSFVPESLFVGQYPPYAGAGGHLLSGGVARRLCQVSRRVALFPLPDVYTGMCLEKLGIVPGKHSGFRTSGVQEGDGEDPCTYRSLMLVHSQTPQEMLRTWPWLT